MKIEKDRTNASARPSVFEVSINFIGVGTLQVRRIKSIREESADSIGTDNASQEKAVHITRLSHRKSSRSRSKHNFVNAEHPSSR
jgi:hypothetical protein